jgi:hypothetical protein
MVSSDGGAVEADGGTKAADAFRIIAQNPGIPGLAGEMAPSGVHIEWFPGAVMQESLSVRSCGPGVAGAAGKFYAL